MPQILYFCPDIQMRSGGMRTLYRHVAHLVKNGFPAAIIHQEESFRMPDMPSVPIRDPSTPKVVCVGDALVIPEGCPGVMKFFKDHPLRKVAICQNWSYAFKHLEPSQTWREMNIERILTYPRATGDFLAWATRLPVHVFDWGIRGELFYPAPPQKIPQIAYLKRKQHNIDVFKNVLFSRNPDYVNLISWLAMETLTELEYANELRRSQVFLSLSVEEGLHAPYLEAMRCGTLVAGYSGVGAQGALVGEGPQQNCILADNEDYMTLSRRLEPVLQDMLRNDMSRWQPIIKNGQDFSAQFTLEREEKTIIGIWREILERG